MLQMLSSEIGDTEIYFNFFIQMWKWRYLPA
jgi:hypothetical protein